MRQFYVILVDHCIAVSYTHLDVYKRQVPFQHRHVADGKRERLFGTDEHANLLGTGDARINQVTLNGSMCAGWKLSR